MSRRPLIVAAAAAVLFTILTLLVAVRFGPLMRADAAVSGAAHDMALAHPAWRAFFAAVTRTGGPAVVWVAGLLAGLVLIVRGRRRELTFLAVTLLGSAFVRLLILNTVARPRPAGRLAAAAGWSFPSGHTTGSATAALTALVLLWPLLAGRRYRWAVAAGIGTWAALVGISRVALVVHWPSDVLGGWLLAVTVVAAARGLQPGAGQADERDGGDGHGRGEGHGQDDEAGEPSASR
ncbi:phosphatase PAP2 family protein [Paractinoplanes durhamensis]|uniref:Phosphatidic acid phosphatase type 2/haloperoxidase domain-containing protein n=1 Tax=Paractinoplanes durhamensis TaxID=113563 RepID=A0ABQ3YUA5_9ACTN|nr:phosphatase PAP2 family protein [Actinoplanes durhamensis]GIE01105.1 hypothetical protein Adu01nite_24550 [Actinoplanes durhamensis]